MAFRKNTFLLLPCLIVSFFCFAFPHYAHAAIGIGLTGTAECQQGVGSGCPLGNTTLSYSATVSGQNPLLVVDINYSAGNSCVYNNGFGAATSSSVTYNGVAMTESTSSDIAFGCTAPSMGRVPSCGIS